MCIVLSQQKSWVSALNKKIRYKKQRCVTQGTGCLSFMHLEGVTVITRWELQVGIQPGAVRILKVRNDLFHNLSTDNKMKGSSRCVPSDMSLNKTATHFANYNSRVYILVDCSIDDSRPRMKACASGQNTIQKQ